MFDKVLNTNLDSVAFLRGFKSGTIKLKPFFYGNKKHFIESGKMVLITMIKQIW